MIEVRRVKPGDGRALRPYRWWQMFSRSLFHLRLSSEGRAPQIWSVDLRHGGDSNGVVWAELYLDGFSNARSKVPAAFVVPGGTIEVVTSAFGLRRCHYVAYDGTERQLEPDPSSAEGRRARLERIHPALSRAMGIASVAVLVVAAVLGAPAILEQITQLPFVAEHVGSFVSPFHLPAWATISLVLATVAASTERALRLRYNRLLDGGIFEGEE